MDGTGLWVLVVLIIIWSLDLGKLVGAIFRGDDLCWNEYLSFKHPRFGSKHAWWHSCRCGILKVTGMATQLQGWSLWWNLFFVWSLLNKNHWMSSKKLVAFHLTEDLRWKYDVNCWKRQVNMLVEFNRRLGYTVETFVRLLECRGCIAWYMML